MSTCQAAVSPDNRGPGSDRGPPPRRVFEREPRPDANHRIAGSGQSKCRPHDQRLSHGSADSLAVPHATVDPDSDCSTHAYGNAGRGDLRREPLLPRVAP